MIALSLALGLTATYAYLLGTRYLKSRELPAISPEAFDSLSKEVKDLIARVKALEVTRAFGGQR